MWLGAHHEGGGSSSPSRALQGRRGGPPFPCFPGFVGGLVRSVCVCTDCIPCWGMTL